MTYLQTLEGVPRFGYVSSDRAKYLRDTFCFFYKNNFADEPDEVQRILKSIQGLEYHATPEEIDVVIQTLPIALFDLNKTGKQPAADEAVNLYRWQKEAEAERDARDAQRIADKEREALDERRRMDKEIVIIDPSGEVSQDVEEIKPEPQDGGISEEQIIQEAQTAINEGDTMEQEIQLQTQIITPGSDWTKIDETTNTISYEDENGDIHIVEKKKSGLGWLLAAAAAFWFLG